MEVGGLKLCATKLFDGMVVLTRCWGFMVKAVQGDWLIGELSNCEQMLARIATD